MTSNAHPPHPAEEPIDRPAPVWAKILLTAAPFAMVALVWWLFARLT
jgi:hypothetical protein